MNPTLTHLQQLLAQYEGTAKNLREVIALIETVEERRPMIERGAREALAPTGNGDAPAPRPTRAEAREARREREGYPARGAEPAIPEPAPSREERARARIERTRARRALSITLLAKFDKKVARTPAEIGADARLIIPLARWGYLRRRGDAFLRTAKPFVLDPNDQFASLQLAPPAKKGKR